MNEKMQLALRDVLIYKQKKERLEVRPRTYSALSLKMTTGGRYIADGTVTNVSPGALCLVPADVA